jgi:hypothetical protein
MFRTMLLALAVVSFAPTADAESFKPTSVTASSTLPPSEGVEYTADKISDSKASTPWIEGDGGSGLGQWIRLDLDGEQEVREIKIWNGNWYSFDFWTRSNRVKEIEVELSDGSKHLFTLKDEQRAEVIKLPSGTKTSSVKIKIKSIYKGSTWNDSCFSEILLSDGKGLDFANPTSTASSGFLEEDSDGTYGVENAFDTLKDTMWCESDPAGDGTGSWVEYQFGSPTAISRLKLHNGNAYGITQCTSSNRAKVIRLDFSDGSSHTVSKVSGSCPLLKQYAFTSRTVTSVKMTFTSVTKGSAHNDLCISEARFSK